jgi:hypothetical protein
MLRAQYRVRQLSLAAGHNAIEADEVDLRGWPLSALRPSHRKFKTIMPHGAFRAERRPFRVLDATDPRAAAIAAESKHDSDRGYLDRFSGGDQRKVIQRDQNALPVSN